MVTEKEKEIYELQGGIFPKDEEFCFNCCYHKRNLKCLCCGTCMKSGLITHNSGWCSSWLVNKDDCDGLHCQTVHCRCEEVPKKVKK